MTEIDKVFEISSKFVWEIDFPFHIKNDSQCKSPNFHVSDLDFYIQIGSDSQPDGLKENISIFLFDYKETPMDVAFRLDIKTANSTSIGKELTEYHTFGHTGCGSSVFTKRSELLKRMSELVPPGTLTVTCFVIVKNSTPCLYSSYTDLAEDLKNLFISKEDSDVKLYVKGRKFSAHRTILAARCSVFAAMFRNDTVEKKTGVVKITDYDPVAFRMFLSFLYSGKVDFAKCNVCELYKISDKYDVVKLKLFCTDFMIQNLSTDNFYEILILSHQFEEKEILGFLQSFFNKNFEKIVSSSNWDNFSKKHFRLVNILLKSMAPKISIME